MVVSILFSNVCLG